MALVGIVTLEQTKRPLGYINCPPVASVSTSTPASARTAGVIYLRLSPLVERGTQTGFHPLLHPP